MKRIALVLLAASCTAHASIHKPKAAPKGLGTTNLTVPDFDQEILLCAQKRALTRMEFPNRTIAAKPVPAYELGWRVTWSAASPKAFTVQPVDPVAPEGVEFIPEPHRTDMDVYLTSGEIVSVVLDTCKRAARTIRVTVAEAPAAAPLAVSHEKTEKPAAPARNWRYLFVPDAARRDESLALAPDAVSDDGTTMCIQYAQGRTVPAFYLPHGNEWIPATPAVADGCINLPLHARVLIAIGSTIGGIAREDAIARPAVPEPAPAPALKRTPR